MSYDSIERSEHDAVELFLYVFSGPSFTYRHATSPVTATISAVVYTFTRPEGGISHEDGTESQDAERGDVTVRVARTHPLIRKHRSFPPPGDTELVIYRLNEESGDPYMVWSGVVTEVSVDGAQGEIRAQTLLALVAGSDGLSETYGPDCPFMLYHSPCPAPSAPFKDALTVAAIDTEDMTATLTGSSRIAQWYRAGVAEAPDGDKRFILDDSLSGASHVLTLQNNFPSTTLRVGDTVYVYAGCNRTKGDCTLKFGLYTGDGAAFGGNNLQANVNPHEIGRVQ